MALKPQIDSLDSVDEALRSHYKKADEGDGFVLDVTGMVPKAKVDEFRETNIKLAKERDELKATVEAFGEATPEEIEEMRAKVAKIPDLETANAGKLDEAVKSATQKMAEEHRAQIEAKDKIINDLTGKTEALESDLASTKIDHALRDVAATTGVRSTAIDDFTRRGRDIFKLDKDGRIVPKNADGSTVYGPNAEPLSMKEWADQQTKAAPHLFEPNGGGGAGGGKGGDSGKVLDRNAENVIGQNLEEFASGEARLGD